LEAPFVSTSRRTTVVLTIATVAAFASVAAVLGLGVAFGGGAVVTGGTTSQIVLPAGCTRPTNGFLIIQNNDGYNNSRSLDPWPVVKVKQGQTVNIAVCNVDVSAHGFQIASYDDGHINVVEPGQVLNVSFVANQQGSFLIFCVIPCDSHPYMQAGQLRVLS
jgi:heme/copper-type cytochrome/quinol oxidase subunit 2